MEIKKREVMERLTAASVAAYYYSASASGKDYSAVRRVPLVSASRYGLLDEYWQEGGRRIVSRLSGWTESCSCDGETLRARLLSRYAGREEMLRALVVEMLVWALWGRIVEIEYPNIAAEAQKRYEEAEDTMLTLLV